MSQMMCSCHAAVNASMSRRWKPSKAWRTVSARALPDTRGLLCPLMGGDVDPFLSVGGGHVVDFEVGDFQGLHAPREGAELSEDLGRADVAGLRDRPVVIAGAIPDELGMPVRGELVHVHRLERLEPAPH